MAKKQADPNQIPLPGVVLDDQRKLDFAEPGGAKKARKSNGKSNGDGEHLPPNLAKPVKVKVPDFSNPKRPKTCLEVDFPLVPINALAKIETSSGPARKRIYCMSKWWARRASSVFRSLLIAAATESPVRKNPDGSLVMDDQGQPIPDETEAAKAVWDVYYANHQAAENFKHLKVLDCFMGGGTTLVEGSRLGFQVSGVDLNPVAWFVVKNELACTDPAEVKRFFDQIEAEVKPIIQPFYVSDCPRGHKGKWYENTSPRPLAGEGPGVREAIAGEGDRPMPPEFDPLNLPPEERKKYRYEGPEIIYTFWAKHGPCSKPGCNHRTPVFRSPIVATKKLGVKFIELKCKECKTAFDAELGDARIAPAAEHIVLPNEKPFTALSQPFAKRLLEYNEGKKEEKKVRAAELYGMVESEPGLKCPNCGAFAGQYLRDVLNNHRQATTAKVIDKKHLRIEPPRNGKKPVYCTLLIDPQWLKGSPGENAGSELGGFIDAPVAATDAWYRERLKNLRLIEVRGNANGEVLDDEEEGTVSAEAGDESQDVSDDAENEKTWLPETITLRDGRKIETGRGTVPKRSAFTCGSCGQLGDLLDSVKGYTNRAKTLNEDPTAQRSAPVMVYCLQCYDPQRDADKHPYGGRYFKVPEAADIKRLIAAEREWTERRDSDLSDYWPRSALPYTWMTHHLNGGIPNWGFTHWYKFFNTRQLLVHTQLLHAIDTAPCDADDVGACRDHAIGAWQEYSRHQCMFSFWDVQQDCLAPLFANPNYHPKARVVENNLFLKIGRENWNSCREGVLAGLAWAKSPTELWLPLTDEASKSLKIPTNDPILPGVSTIVSGSATEMTHIDTGTIDLIVTDPPFGDNVFYGDLANFFYVWLRSALNRRSSGQFAQEFVPRAQEAVADRSRFPNVRDDDDDDTGDSDAEEEILSAANVAYQDIMTACWGECRRVMKDGGVLAFTFHHSADEPWMSILQSLFEAGWLLEATYPIRSDETKGDSGQFGSRKIEYDIIHVCRKRLEQPTPVSWPKMRQWVKAELKRLRLLLESYKARELSDADIRVILRGKALEFYSRHYGQVFTSENEPLSIRDALLGINQLLDEDTGQPGERPPSVVQPMAYQFLRLFGHHQSLSRDELGKSLRGTGIVQRELEQRGWIEEQGRIVSRVPISDRFDKARKRPRKEMKSEIDQAHFLIGAAMPGSGVNLEDELSRDTWMVRRSVEAVLDWYAKTALEPEVQKAAALAGNLLRMSLEQNRTKIKEEQGYLFDDLSEDE